MNADKLMPISPPETEEVRTSCLEEHCSSHRNLEGLLPLFRVSIKVSRSQSYIGRAIKRPPAIFLAVCNFVAVAALPVVSDYQLYSHQGLNP